jgi:hypothetical protein
MARFLSVLNVVKANGEGLGFKIFLIKYVYVDISGQKLTED